MKTYLLLLSTALLVATGAAAQSVGINTATADASAALEIPSTTKGVLIPRLTQAQRTIIATPAKGLLVFDSTSRSFWFHDGTVWQEIDTATNVWKPTGNTGTDTSIHFIGTTDDIPLIFKVGGIKSGIIDSEGQNTAFGSEALLSNIDGFANTAIGSSALYASTTGFQNTAIGDSALDKNTIGAYNTAIGGGALFHNIGGEFNTAGGAYSLFNANTALYNTAYGAHSLYSNSSGEQNTAMGHNAMFHSTGSSNTAVGYQALNSNAAGNGNTAIGALAYIPADLSNSTAVGYGAVATASNQVMMGNTSVTSIGGLAGWSNFSDGRFKRNVKENVPGLAFISQLKPVTYNLAIKKINEYHGVKDDVMNGLKADYSNAEKMVRTGFIAQDVEKTAQQIGYDFDGVHHPQNDRDNYSLVYADLVPSLVKTVQELNNKIEEQQKQIKELLKVIAEQKK
jgi:hypothetical protein